MIASTVDGEIRGGYAYGSLLSRDGEIRGGCVMGVC
jgi:hypothetical protein